MATSNRKLTEPLETTTQLAELAAGGYIERAEPVVLTEGGLMAGVTAEAEYRSAEVRLRPGDRLWVYSDGLPEAMSPAGEPFGPARLSAAFRIAGVRLSDAVRAVLGAVEGWAGPGGPQDDVSVVVLEVGETEGREGHAGASD